LANFKAAPSSEGNNPKAEAEADNLTNDLLFIKNRLDSLMTRMINAAEFQLM
jgi:hypothetical protein